MAESSMRKIGRNNEDRISELPLNLQETILCFLPIQDAVRTSALSTKWRHCWTTIPNLIFDHRFSIFDELRHYQNLEVKSYKFVSVINKVLLLHNGPILKFSLTFPQGYKCDAQIVHEFVDQWIPLFSRKGIKQLILEEYDDHGELTAHNFSSLDLTHLRFTRGFFPCTPAFAGYTNLRILELVLVHFDFEESICECPALEKLTLLYCRALFPIHFRAPNLKCLRQAYDDITLEFVLPGFGNLTEYSCFYEEGLEDLGNTISQTETSNVVKLLGSLDKIETFSSRMHFLKYLAAGGSPNRLSKPLPYLKTLNMCDINFSDMSQFSCLLCLIRSAPNLFELNISCWSNREEDIKNYQIKDSKDCTLDHLEIVTFSFFRGLKAELELVKFLLGHSLLLKTVSIHRSPHIIKDAAYVMAEEMILQYPRASSRVQIRELKDPFTIAGFDSELELWQPD